MVRLDADLFFHHRFAAGSDYISGAREGSIGGRHPSKRQALDLLRRDVLINWARKNSLWPMFFGLSCCFVEEATAFTSRYDLARFGAEVLRPSPRQADLLIISGTIFQKGAPVVLRLVRTDGRTQMGHLHGFLRQLRRHVRRLQRGAGHRSDPAGGCLHSGLSAPARSRLKGLVMLQEKIRPKKAHALARGSPPAVPRGRNAPVLVDGLTKSRDPRGPGMDGTAIRGTSVTPLFFGQPLGPDVDPAAAHRTRARTSATDLAQSLRRASAAACRNRTHIGHADLRGAMEQVKEVLRYLKTEATPKFMRLDDLTAIDESARRDRRAKLSGFHDGLPAAFLRPAGGCGSRCPARRNPHADSVTDIWPSADWYEREVFDMFGIISTVTPICAG
jgi:NADH:ubiquinone oxidoreductase subunit C